MPPTGMHRVVPQSTGGQQVLSKTRDTRLLNIVKNELPAKKFRCQMEIGVYTN
jgi:hypothetical protein